MKVLTVFAIAVPLIAARIAPGKCPEEIKSLRDFDLNKVSGDWYSTVQYPNEYNASCRKMNVKVIEGNALLYNIKYWDNALSKPGNIQVTLSQTNPNVGDFSMEYELNGKRFQGQPNQALDTDYDNYIVFYSCIDDWEGSKNTMNQRVYIDSRALTIEKDTLKKIYNLLEDYNVPTDILENLNTDQTHCSEVI